MPTSTVGGRDSLQALVAYLVLLLTCIAAVYGYRSSGCRVALFSQRLFTGGNVIITPWSEADVVQSYALWGCGDSEPDRGLPTKTRT